MTPVTNIVWMAILATAGQALAEPPKATELPSSADFHVAMLDWSRQGVQSAVTEELQLPVRAARFSSHFGPRHDPMESSLRVHWGVDIPEPLGTPVDAAASGVVIFAGRAGGYGNLVKIDHGGGSETRYAHLSAIMVGVGDELRQGDRVGNVGSTGRSTGPHLHFELRDHGRAIDPEMNLGFPLIPVVSETEMLPTQPAELWTSPAAVLPNPMLRGTGVTLPLADGTTQKATHPTG